jgi:hypothetical protein
MREGLAIGGLGQRATNLTVPHFFNKGVSMAGIIRQHLSDHVYLFALFFRAGIGMAVLIYLATWLLYPEHSAAGRTYFFVIGFLVFTIAGIIQSALVYRKNKLETKHVNKEQS